jgi:6-phosphogluconolactonase
MSVELHTYPDAEALARDVAARWLGLLDARLKSPAADTPYCVALSGGRIAKNFFSEIARQAAGRPELFKNVHFFWADERCVPPTDPESNYAIARQLLFEPLKIPDNQVHRLRGEDNEALALRDAVNDIEKWGQKAALFDMIFLGVGENGHVASLFPEEPESLIADPAIYRAVTTTKPPPRRITLGYGVIIGAREVWTLVSGAGKEEAFKESLSSGGKTPLAQVLQRRSRTVIFSDIKT